MQEGTFVSTMILSPLCFRSRGFSSNGRALALQVRGTGIDTRNLHYMNRRTLHFVTLTLTLTLANNIINLHPSPQSYILGSIVVSIPACHAGDRGSIPRRGGYLFPTSEHF